MTDPRTDGPARRGHVSVRMSTWSGTRTEPRYFTSWEALIKFLRSDSFALVPDVRSFSAKQLADSPARWKPTPEERAELEERARRELTCRACRAAPGQPCTGADPGYAVCGPRYVDMVKMARAEMTAQMKGTTP